MQNKKDSHGKNKKDLYGKVFMMKKREIRIKYNKREGIFAR